MSTIDRRALLKLGAGAAAVPILGAVAVTNAQQLILPDQPSNQILLATQTLPEPIGQIAFEYSRVMIRWGGEPPYEHPFTEFTTTNKAIVNEYAQVVIEGFARNEDVQRSKEYFRVGDSLQKIKVYIAKA